MPIEREHRGIDGYIYLTACRYYRAAHYIPKDDRGAPYFVNLAFSTELFIKCLDVSTKTVFESEQPFQMIPHDQTIHARVRGHSLKGMFESLPDYIQVALSESYLNSTGNSIHDDLEVIKDVFVDWCYHFEKLEITLPLGVVERIATFLKDYIEYALKH